MISDELMRRSNAADVIERAVRERVSLESIQQRSADMVGTEFPLVLWKGAGRIVAAGDGGVSVQVRGMRADYSWDRLAASWRRLRDNHALGIDELGGGHDAVGIVSLFAFLEASEVDVLHEQGMLVRHRREKHRENPIHQFADVGTPTAWPQWRHHVHGS
jgi:hypothetical protein